MQLEERKLRRWRPVASTVFVIHCNFRTPHTYRMPSSVRRLFLYWLPRLLFIRRPMYRLRAARKPYNRRRPIDETGYPACRPEVTSEIDRRAGTVAVCELRRRTAALDDGGNGSRSLSRSDKELGQGYCQGQKRNSVKLKVRRGTR